MMKGLILFLVCSLAGLSAFEPIPVTPVPVVGYREAEFFDQNQNIQRKLLIYYPVGPLVNGTPSENAWDVYNKAINAEIATPEQQKPVIVVSHGYTGKPNQLSWLILKLVHAGNIVLAIHHSDLNNGKVHLNLWKRPQDIKTIIDQFTALPMSKYADLNKIGLAGFSLGGSTTIWVAGGLSTKLEKVVPDKDYVGNDEDFSKVPEALEHMDKNQLTQSWKDDRVKAIFAMAPAWAWIFDAESLSKINIPTYIIAAEKDSILVSSKNAGYFAKNIPNSILQIFPGKADHFIFVSALDNAQKKSISPNGEFDFIIKDDPSVDRRWIQYQVAEEAIRFFDSVFQDPRSKALIANPNHY